MAIVATDRAMCPPPRGQAFASSTSCSRSVTTTKFHGCQFDAEGARRPASRDELEVCASDRLVGVLAHIAACLDGVPGLHAGVLAVPGPLEAARAGCSGWSGTRCAGRICALQLDQPRVVMAVGRANALLARR